MSLGKCAAETIGSRYGTMYRWSLISSRMEAEGLVKREHASIPVITAEVQDDVLARYRDEIKEELFRIFWPEIKKELVKGLGSWYRTEIDAKEAHRDEGSPATA